MTPHQYYQLRKHHALLEEAKQLVKLRTNTVANRIKIVAFKQKAGMMPAEYIERYDNCWKD